MPHPTSAHTHLALFLAPYNLVFYIFILSLSGWSPPPTLCHCKFSNRFVSDLFLAISLGTKTVPGPHWKWWSLSYVRLFVTPWTVVGQVPLPIEFARQEHWSELPFTPPRGSSPPRDRTQVSRIVDRRLTVWATREVLDEQKGSRITILEVKPEIESFVCQSWRPCPCCTF